MPCCRTINDPNGAIWERHFASWPLSNKCALFASPVVAVALLAIGSLALLGLHDLIPALAPFGGAIGETAAYALIGGGALATLIALSFALKLYKNYFKECESEAELDREIENREWEPLSPEEEEDLAWLIRRGIPDAKSPADDYQRYQQYQLRVENSKKLSEEENSEVEDN